MGRYIELTRYQWLRLCRSNTNPACNHSETPPTVYASKQRNGHQEGVRWHDKEANERDGDAKNKKKTLIKVRGLSSSPDRIHSQAHHSAQRQCCFRGGLTVLFPALFFFFFSPLSLLSPLLFLLASLSPTSFPLCPKHKCLASRSE